MTHYRSRAGLRVTGLACLATSLMVGGVAAADEVQQLRDMVDSLRSEVDVLRAEQQTDWMSEQRAEEIRELVQDVLADADTRASLQGSGMAAGYDGGFFIQSDDNSFKLKFNGQLQTRWLFNHRSTDNPAESGNSYGFEVRRFKLKFSGYVVDPSWQLSSPSMRVSSLLQKEARRSAWSGLGLGLVLGLGLGSGLGLELG